MAIYKNENGQAVKYSGSGIIDAALSSTSKNPVQNKVIAQELSKKADRIFYDEENNKLEFEQIALINIDESRYAILHPVDMGYQDDDAIAYEIKEENGNFELLEVEDDDLLEEIYKRFKSLVKASKRPRK